MSAQRINDLPLTIGQHDWWRVPAVDWFNWAHSFTGDPNRVANITRNPITSFDFTKVRQCDFDALIRVYKGNAALIKQIKGSPGQLMGLSSAILVAAVHIPPRKKGGRGWDSCNGLRMDDSKLNVSGAVDGVLGGSLNDTYDSLSRGFVPNDVAGSAYKCFHASATHQAVKVFAGNLGGSLWSTGRPLNGTVAQCRTSDWQMFKESQMAFLAKALWALAVRKFLRVNFGAQNTANFENAIINKMKSFRVQGGLSPEHLDKWPRLKTLWDELLSLSGEVPLGQVGHEEMIRINSDGTTRRESTSAVINPYSNASPPQDTQGSQSDQSGSGGGDTGNNTGSSSSGSGSSSTAFTSGSSVSGGSFAGLANPGNPCGQHDPLCLGTLQVEPEAEEPVEPEPEPTIFTPLNMGVAGAALIAIGGVGWGIATKKIKLPKLPSKLKGLLK